MSSFNIHLRRIGLVAIASLLVGGLTANAAIFEDFLFNDPAGTLIEEVVNSSGSGHMFDLDPDTATVATNGFGQLNASLKNNTGFGTNYIDNDTLSTGTIYGVIELSWDFQSMLDPAENEQVRISLINSDPRSTEITAELRIERTDDDQIVINGQAGGTGSSDLSNTLLNGGSLTQSQKFIGVVAADLDTSTYEILYSVDGGSNFQSAGTGLSAPGRIVESFRMTLNNDLMDDNILIDRLYLTDENPVAMIDQLTLEVNTTTGNVRLLNDTGAATFDIDHYRISSDSMSLDFDNWNSLDDQNYDAIGGGVGQSWDEAGGSSDSVLSESFLLGSSEFDPGEFVSLGRAFSVGGMEDLAFTYHDAANGNVFDGSVVYVTGGVTGDFDGNGAWDCADIDALVAAIASNSTDLSFDMNGDGQITAADINEAGTGWLAVGGANNPDDTNGNPFLSGDANLDGVVDGQDFIAWNGNKFTVLSEWCGGDFNADGVVDGQDFVIWNSNKFTSSDGLVNAVPEPTTLGLLAFGLLAMVRLTRRCN